MKKILLTLALVLSFSSAYSMQLPAKQSASIMKDVLDLVSADEGLQFHKIKKVEISESLNYAKVELVNQKGQCLAIPYVIEMNAFGEIEAKADTLALAICD